ncbi:rab-18 [Symbiodinium pilosum]|uniref:Rab-18 protein n=1 Tax=Symbiodinium pilosum TaxID=2952 RepID=A0A812J2U3_SYMPI|nr:rab-18 [Symbiodinium pilosum]
MAESTHDHLFKLLIIGDSGVGKSSILLRFCDDEFNEKQASTIGVDFKTKFMQVRGKKLKLALWDTAGQERFRTLTSSYYRGAQGIILCYDCTQRSSFEHVKFWQDEVRKYSTNQDAILMLVSNKVDLADQQVTRTEGEEFAFANSMMFIETRKPRAEAATIFLVRHGQSTWNLAAKQLDIWTMFRQVDHALTAEGVAQASRLRDTAAAALKQGDEEAERFLSPRSRVFASPLSRAVATAIVALGLQRKITLLPDARELAYPLCGPDSVGAAVGPDIPIQALQGICKVDSNYCDASMTELASEMIDASAAEKVWWNRFRESKSEMKQRLQRLLRTLRPVDNLPHASILVCHSLLIQRLFKDFASPEMEAAAPQLLSRLRASKLQNCGAVKVTLDEDNLISSAQLVFGTKLVQLSFLDGWKSFLPAASIDKRQGIKTAFEEVVFKILDTPSLLQSTQPLGTRQVDAQSQRQGKPCANAMDWCSSLLRAAVLLCSPQGTASDVAIISLATNDYYASAQGPHVDRVLMVPEPSQLTNTWRQRFVSLGIKVVDVNAVQPSKSFLEAMASERQDLAKQGLLEVLQPLSYGGAFAKVHAWDESLGYAKVLLLDGDVLVKGDLQGLLKQAPISASKDLADAFNYGVILLKPNNTIHRDLVTLLTQATREDLRRYNKRRANEVGLCDQTLVAGRLAETQKVYFFEDLRRSSRQSPEKWLMSTEYNLVVSYRAKERCELPGERKRVDKARIIHFANNWLNFETLAKDRDSPGRIDSPRCYKAAFRYWHDVYQHALRLADRSSDAQPPSYAPVDFHADNGLARPEEVQAVFLDFQ